MLQIEPFAAEHLNEAAVLLAERHKVYRKLEPVLPARYEDAHESRGLLERSMPDTSGVAAFRGGRLAGYLLGRKAVDHVARVVLVLPQHVCLRQGEDPELYREMYAAAADPWLRDGYFAHYPHVPSFDGEAVEAWTSLGFGRYSVYNWRELAPVAGPEAEIRIRRVFGSEFEEANAVRDGLRRYNATSPILHPLVRPVGPDFERYAESERARMDDPKNLHLLAYDRDRPVGLMIFTPPEPDYPLTPDNACYLHIAYVDEGARAGGVGTAMVNRGLEWAREQGYELCTVGYFAPNLLGARFWQSKGFRPLAYSLERRIDPRIAWASG